jgi:N-hydroxyarylamine O-acetyltransferase
MINLSAYFDRIHYKGPIEATLETLMEIHRLHPKYIPFENLNPLTGRKVSLKMEDIFEKLVENGRGGYCFEQNALFKEVLTTIGFDVSGLWGRVVWNNDSPVAPARTHMLLLIVLDGQQYIADVGFGSVTLTAPLLFTSDIVQETQHGIFRIILKEKYYILQVLQQKEWRPIYHFYTEIIEAIDYEVANWYVSTHPDSNFTKQLIATKVDDDGRYVLNNNMLTIRYDSGRKESLEMCNKREIIKTLEDVFGICTGSIHNLEEALAVIDR